MFTRKHYIVIAKALKEVQPYSKDFRHNHNVEKHLGNLYYDTVDSLADTFRRDNELFDADKFKRACGL